MKTKYYRLTAIILIYSCSALGTELRDMGPTCQDVHGSVIYKNSDGSCPKDQTPDYMYTPIAYLEASIALGAEIEQRSLGNYGSNSSGGLGGSIQAIGVQTEVSPTLNNNQSQGQDQNQISNLRNSNSNLGYNINSNSNTNSVSNTNSIANTNHIPNANNNTNVNLDIPKHWGGHRNKGQKP